eukprot:m.67489 g.67489  ORF g.67489 m.67489 type:complete len:188 (+) comp23820_c0_seq2:388-951(+)
MGCCGSSVKEEDEHVDERTNLLSSQSHLSNTNGKSINGESSGPPLSIPDARYNEEEEEADPLNILQTKLDLIAHKFERNVIVSLEDKIVFLADTAVQHKKELYRPVKEKLQNKLGMVATNLPPPTPRGSIDVLAQPLLRSPIALATRNDFSQAMSHLAIVNLKEPVSFEASDFESYSNVPHVILRDQ